MVASFTALPIQVIVILTPNTQIQRQYL